MQPDDNRQANPGIQCPQCGCPMIRVVETRRRLRYIQRRRECRHCNHRFTTREMVIGRASAG